MKNKKSIINYIWKLLLAIGIISLWVELFVMLFLCIFLGDKPAPIWIGIWYTISVSLLLLAGVIFIVINWKDIKDSLREIYESFCK